jgi:hypothetical protein
MIRVQTYPWSDGIDQRTMSDAARALALGATAVTISIASHAPPSAIASAYVARFFTPAHCS